MQDIVPDHIPLVYNQPNKRPMEKLLIIDDQPQVLEIVSYLLDAEGYEVMTATNGREGLEAAKQFRPDLIICDIMMPGMNGYDVLEAARRDPDLATIPFIFLTAKATPGDLRTGMTAGADDYLTKPFTDEELLAAVRTQLSKRAIVQDRFQQKIDLLRQGISTILPHELRTPLTLILAHTSLLLETGPTLDKDSLMEMIRTIHESGLRLHRLLENLLVYVSMEGDTGLPVEAPLTPHAKVAILDAAIKRAEAHNRPEDLRTNVTDGEIRMHAFHLRKIIEELVDNAFKFSSRGKPVRLVVTRDDGDLCIEVSDEGRGMSQEQIETIDAYVQFKRYIFEQQGAGVGLTLTKRLVELYGGTFQIDSASGVGTTARIRIPHAWVEHAIS